MQVCTVMEYVRPRIISAEEPDTPPVVETPPIFFAYAAAMTHDHYGEGQSSTVTPSLCAYRPDRIANDPVKGFGMWATPIPLAYAGDFPARFDTPRFFPAANIILV